VTRDNILTVAASVALGVGLGRPDWPDFLEGTAFWVADGFLHVRYRDHAG
jgi:hypothetical protein